MRPKQSEDGMDSIVKLYATKLLKDEIKAKGRKPQDFPAPEFNKGVKAIAEMANFKQRAYEWFNSDKAET